MVDYGIYKRLIRTIHLEPTSGCNARCPQCPRTYDSFFKTMPGLEINEWSPEELKRVLDHEYFSNVFTVVINGNFGDIVKHSNPKGLIEVLVDRGMRIKINTNGGALSTDFWTWLGEQHNVNVEFGIDGLEDTHHLYRRNTLFSVVMKNAKAYIDAGGEANWAMTIFKHNEHQEEECRELAKQYGFKQFKSRVSMRWGTKDLIVYDKKHKPEYSLEPASVIEDNYKHRRNDIVKNFQPQYPKAYNESYDIAADVQCQADQDAMVYLSAEKKLWPCCWVGQEVQSDDLKNTEGLLSKKLYTELKLDREFNNVTKHDITDILNTGLFRHIEESWSSVPFRVCAQTCNKRNGKWKNKLKHTKKLEIK